MIRLVNKISAKSGSNGVEWASEIHRPDVECTHIDVDQRVCLCVCVCLEADRFLPFLFFHSNTPTSCCAGCVSWKSRSQNVTQILTRPTLLCRWLVRDPLYWKIIFLAAFQTLGFRPNREFISPIGGGGGGPFAVRTLFYNCHAMPSPKVQLD